MDAVTRIERAVRCFNKGFSCSQAVLSAYGPRYGLNRGLALRVAGAVGGGMGRMGCTCGAVTGSFMVIGLKYGVTKAEKLREKERAYARVKAFARRFRSRHGSITCRDLLGCDLSTPQGVKIATEKKLFSTLCPVFVRDASSILEDVLSPRFHTRP